MTAGYHERLSEEERKNFDSRAWHLKSHDIRGKADEYLSRARSRKKKVSTSEVIISRDSSLLSSLRNSYIARYDVYAMRFASSGEMWVECFEKLSQSAPPSMLFDSQS